ncbi:hypothetical protein UB31_35050 [Bradyrhizobium sp. LTSP849]|uniref:hypothetical protein n=1 Tax=unclassified Bradyrhizobium TaxID=2631580 RepID=UPI0005D2C82E|nr:MULTISPECIES: hypothetical protein [unclassified Bradyrhizobium]KJC37541.1 hypothetical protein UB31_35050 [Bradyrhizobium sp. LTSP849]KJC46273.1 hypothetical protein UP06_13795 [Bradyrhizobium sp. LTSP857]
MSTRFTKPVLAFSVLASLMASATANAGTTISDQRYWPNEVGSGSYHARTTQHPAHDAFAAAGTAISPAMSAPRDIDASATRYVGGPKSSIAPSRGF